MKMYENGEYYIGQFRNGLRNDKGILYYKNGNIKYDGEFVDDEFEGNGKYYYENGEYYVGNWYKGSKGGKGKMYYKNRNIKCYYENGEQICLIV